MRLLIRNARILTLAGDTRPRRGAALRELGVIDHGDVLVGDGKIEAVGAQARRAGGGGGRRGRGPGADAGFCRLPHAGVLGGRPAGRMGADVAGRVPPRDSSGAAAAPRRSSAPSARRPGNSWRPASSPGSTRCCARARPRSRSRAATASRRRRRLKMLRGHRAREQRVAGHGGADRPPGVRIRGQPRRIRADGREGDAPGGGAGDFPTLRSTRSASGTPGRWKPACGCSRRPASIIRSACMPTGSIRSA